MAARCTPRFLVNGALLALVLAFPVMSCPTSDGSHVQADASQSEKSKAERCKREGARSATKGCTDGGERLPQDKRSPLDKIPPLSPLVA
jgi:hypothetical protein